jgi:hypothetical protein
LPLCVSGLAPLGNLPIALSVSVQVVGRAILRLSHPGTRRPMPVRPEGTEDWDEDQLAAILTHENCCPANRRTPPASPWMSSNDSNCASTATNKPNTMFDVSPSISERIVRQELSCPTWIISMLGVCVAKPVRCLGNCSRGRKKSVGHPPDRDRSDQVIVIDGDFDDVW